MFTCGNLFTTDDLPGQLYTYLCSGPESIAAGIGFTNVDLIPATKFTHFGRLSPKIHKTGSLGAGPVYQQTVGDEF